MIIAYAAAVLCLALVLANLASMALAARRWLRRRETAAPAHRPPVSIVRPLCGIEPFSRETLEATFAIDWPAYEIIFCVQRSRDAIIPLVEAAIAAHPNVAARLLVGDDPISSNPKLNNCVKGWNAARHDYIAIVDSNALTPPDYLARMMRAFRPDAGLVVSMPLGTRPDGWAAEYECALLNTYQARWQYAAEALGNGFAQGKNMLWRREVLERAGGIAALAAEIAEDAASTKLVRRQGLRVRLVDYPFEQPLGARTFRTVWSRHARWARLRRVTFPAHFAPEIATGLLPPLICGLYAAHAFELNAAAVAGGVSALLLGAEMALAAAAGFPLSWRTPLALALRDISLPALWVDAWLVDDFTWHGHRMSVRRNDEIVEDAP